jgi:hypothetical protein
MENVENTELEQVKKNIDNIINQFMKEELGNRLSQFSLISLRSLIMAEIDKLKIQEP